jgi:GT2 family glycosyltransferase
MTEHNVDAYRSNGHEAPAPIFPTAATVGAVVIGRNEGARLVTCLQSLRQADVHVVYVDSASSDDSVQNARRLGAAVVQLDMSLPFTAARARNAGAAALRKLLPQLSCIQFIDGDCELTEGWLKHGVNVLESRQELTAVFGRLRERHPRASIYNLMCDAEWDTPAGPAKSFGGIFLIRARPFFAVNGFREDLIAGEEPELCVRLRACGAKLLRIDAEMALHDAALRRFSQWWRRAARGGHAYIEGARLHGQAPERHWVMETRRAFIWAVLLPLLCCAAFLVYQPLGWLIFSIYPVQIVRTAFKLHGTWRDRIIHSTFLLLAKFAEAQGMFRYLGNRLRQKHTALIEYK